MSDNIPYLFEVAPGGQDQILSNPKSLFLKKYQRTNTLVVLHMNTI